MMYLFISEITAAIAEAAIRQSPYFPVGLETVCNAITEMIFSDKDEALSKLIAKDDDKRDAMIGTTPEQLRAIIDNLDSIQEFRHWNLSKVEREQGVDVDDPGRSNVFTSRYDSVRADHDFVDLDALKRNVFNRIMNNHHEFMADEAKFANNAYQRGEEEYFGRPAELQINKLIKDTHGLVTDNISDGYHTFGELYNHRIALWIALCKKFDQHPGYIRPWRTLKHSDGELAFGGKWFVLGLSESRSTEPQPPFQITYHLPIEKWEECEFASTLDKAPEFDGHTPADVLERLGKLL